MCVAGRALCEGTRVNGAGSTPPYHSRVSLQGRTKSKEETKRKEWGEHMAIERKEQGDRGRVEIHTCDGEAA